MTLFDHLDSPPEPEQEAKSIGMARAAIKHSTILDWARDAIYRRWKDLKRSGVRDYVTADDVRELLEIAFEIGTWERPSNMNWMGSIFAGKAWEFTGNRVKSRTPGSHANELKCWVYVGTE